MTLNDAAAKDAQVIKTSLDQESLQKRFGFSRVPEVLQLLILQLL